MKWVSIVLVLFIASCGGNLSVKQRIDRDDRVAFESLRTLQQAESAAFHARLPWPTDDQHQKIGAALSKAYDLVIDVAQAGIALKQGDPLPQQLQAETQQLLKLISDVISLVAAAPPNVKDAATKAQNDTSTLVNTVTGGK